MIAVIADDFTGAAEIGGIGLKHGLKVLIETKVKVISGVDLLIIATDTRSLTAQKAALEITKITEKLLQQKPDFIFKKLDSVLRGNIAGELYAQMLASGKNRSIIVAGNPFLKRRIQNGLYTINSIPLNLTHFASDPDFPVNTSSALEIIGEGVGNVCSKSVVDDLPVEGLIIGDVTNADEMNDWVLKIDKDTIPAGGSGFFDVILSSLYTQKIQKDNTIVYSGSQTLFVMGSTFPKSKEILARLSGDGIVKKNMPKEIYTNNDFKQDHFNQWATEIVACLKKQQKVIVSVDYVYSSEENIAVRTKNLVAKLIKRVMKEIELSDLFIEGGATTSEILSRLKIDKLYPFRELEFGIIQMKSDKYPNLTITTKPGSYTWPENIRFENARGTINIQ